MSLGVSEEEEKAFCVCVCVCWFSVHKQLEFNFQNSFPYFSKFSRQPNGGHSSILLLLCCYSVYGHFGNFDDWVIGFTHYNWVGLGLG